MGRAPSCSKEVWRKGPWSPEEDALLIKYIEANTIENYCWRSLPRQAGLMRSGKSCRLRWINYLRPDVKRGSISPEEEDLILRLHRLIGNRWSLIAGRLPGRTDNEIKNFWKCHLRKKVENGSMIDLQPKKSRRKGQNDVVLNRHPAVSFTVPPNSVKEPSRRESVPSSPRHEMCAKNEYKSKGKPEAKGGYILRHFGANCSNRFFGQHFEKTCQKAGLEDLNHLADLGVPALTGDSESDFQLVCPNSIFPFCVMDADVDVEHCFQLLEAAVISSPSSPEEVDMVLYSNSETSSSGRSKDGASCSNMEPSNQTLGKNSYPTILSFSASETFSLIEHNEELSHNFETEMLTDTQVLESMVTPYGRGYCNTSENCGSVKQLHNRDQVFVAEYYTDGGHDLSGNGSDMQKAFDTLYAFEDFQTCVSHRRPSTAMNSDQTPNCIDVQEDFLYFKNVCPDNFAYFI